MGINIEYYDSVCFLSAVFTLNGKFDISQDTQSKTLTTLNAKHLQLTPYIKHGYILYIYLILTTKLYIKRHLKTMENTPIKSVINLTSYKIFFKHLFAINTCLQYFVNSMYDNTVTFCPILFPCYRLFLRSEWTYIVQRFYITPRSLQVIGEIIRPLQQW